MTRWCRRVRLRKLRKHSIVLAQVPTMILSETRGLPLFWVVRGGIGLKRRLGAELQAHRAPNNLLDTLPRTRASQEPIRYHGVAKPWEIAWGFSLTIKLLALSDVLRRNVLPSSKVSR